MAFSFFIFIFLFRNNDKKNQLNEDDFPHCYGNFFRECYSDSTWSPLYSKSFLSNYKAHWQQHLKGTLQLKILQTRINIGANSFLCKRLETKTDAGAWKIISYPKSWDCCSKDIPSRHFTYYCMLLFLSHKPGF